ncbi:hypothetical protein JW758_00290 [Candidatus Peregrinibacteria bacterium]|nr:hypothetical protein [Candidatus Peregrinibacteria bacterium]
MNEETPNNINFHLMGTPEEHIGSILPVGEGPENLMTREELALYNVLSGNGRVSYEMALNTARSLDLAEEGEPLRTLALAVKNRINAEESNQDASQFAGLRKLTRERRDATLNRMRQISGSPSETPTLM